jgi:hypothetical protein
VGAHNLQRLSIIIRTVDSAMIAGSARKRRDMAVMSQVESPGSDAMMQEC